MKRKECPVCTQSVYPEDDWRLQTPLKEKFTFCSLDCLIMGADNLAGLNDCHEEEKRE